MGFVGSLVCALVITFSWTNPPELYAQPAMPHQFVGTAKINGTTAPDGTVVTATIDGVESATAIVTGGRYQLKIRIAHGLPSPVGKTIKFTVGGQIANESQLFLPGGGTELNLTVTPVPTRAPIAPPIIISPAPLPAPTIAAPSPAQPVAPPAPVQPVAPPAPVQPVAPPAPIVVIVTATPTAPVVIVAPPAQSQPGQPPVLGGVSPGIGQPGQPPVLGGVFPGIGQPGQPSAPVVNAPIPTPAVQPTPAVGPAGPAGPPGPPGESSSSGKTWIIVALVASGLAIFLSLDHIVAVFFRRGGPTTG